jgi:hypothetical protein
MPRPSIALEAPCAWPQQTKAVGCSEREIYDAVTIAAQIVAGDIVLNVFKVQPDAH